MPPLIMPSYTWPLKSRSENKIWKNLNFYYVKGNNSANTKWFHKLYPRCTTTHADQLSCNISWLWVKFILFELCVTSWKLRIFTKSREITLPILNRSTHKTPGAQLNMLNNISVKFDDSRSNTFGVIRDIKLNIANFTNSPCQLPLVRTVLRSNRVCGKYVTYLQ